MQSFDQSLMFLMKEDLITYEEALKHASNPDDFALRVKGILATSDTSWDDFQMTEKEKEGARPRPSGSKTRDGVGRILKP